MNKENRCSPYGLFIWGLAILFFFYEFFLRVLPATIASTIIENFNMSAQQFAIIGSAYYISYSFMQIPVGLLLDRFNAKILITGAVFLCAFGALWFSFAYEFFPAFVSRILIGLGSSFGFIALTITTINWLPRKHFAFLVGCGQFLGAMGPLCAGGPIILLLSALDGDWRELFFWVALFGVGLTILIGLCFKEKPDLSSKVVLVDKKIPLRKQLKNLLSYSQVWWTLIYAGFIYLAIPLLGAFWGISYLETRGLEKAPAGFVISMIWVGLAIGSPILGRVSDVMKRRKPVIAFCAFLGCISSLIFLFTPLENIYFLGGAFFLIGVAGAGQGISFAVMSENATKSLRGTAIGLNNTAVMGFAALIPLFVTSIIRHYSVDGELTELAFEKGFLVIPACFFLALLVSLFGLNETFCRQQNVVHPMRSE